MLYRIRQKNNDDGEYIRLATLRLTDWYTTRLEHADLFSYKLAVRVLNKTRARYKYARDQYELVEVAII